MKFDQKEASKYYKLLGHKEQTERRSIYQSRGKAELHFVDSEKDFVKISKKYNGQANVYAGVNERNKNGTKDKDVKRIDYLFLDIDAIRPKDVCATDEEKKEVWKVTKQIISDFDCWVIDSGNGYQPYMRIPTIELNGNHDEIKARIKKWVYECAKKYDVPGKVEIDKGVHNLSRIMAVPGTWKMKGENTKERPWRMVKFVREPEEVWENKALKEKLMAYELETTKPIVLKETKDISPISAESKPIPNLKQFLADDKKLRKLYMGEWEEMMKDDKPLYKSRSEAEQALLCKLIYYGFEPEQLNDIMSKSKIGRWDELTDNTKIQAMQEAAGLVGDRYCPYFRRGKFIPKRMADYVKGKFNFKTPIDTADIWVYGDGIYTQRGEVFTKEEVRKELGERQKRNHNSETIEAIRDTTIIEREEFNKHIEYICLQNGLLNTKTRELIPHTPDMIFTSKSPIIYNPAADCPNFKKFMGEVVYKGDLDVLQEFFGFCLYSDYFLRRLIILVGGGSNGKTVFMRVLNKFLGEKNVTAVSLQSLSKDKFAISTLFGKRANICDDLPKDKITSTGNIKQLTGGSVVDGQEKFKAHFEFVNTAKMIFAANEPPDIDDLSKAMWDRILMITFPYSFVNIPTKENALEKKKRDREELLKELTTPEELSGILNWSLDGLKRLKAQNDFSYSKTHEETMEDYKRKASPVAAFVLDRIIWQPDGRVKKKFMYAVHVSYCKDLGLPVKSYNVFCQDLIKECGASLTEVKARTGDKRAMEWCGVVLLGADGKPIKKSEVLESEQKDLTTKQ